MFRNKPGFQPLLGMNHTKMLLEEIWNSVTCFDSWVFGGFFFFFCYVDTSQLSGII